MVQFATSSSGGVQSTGGEAMGRDPMHPGARTEG